MNTKNIEKLIRELIVEIGDNPNREGLVETPERVARMFREIYSGYNEMPHNILKLFPNNRHGEGIFVKNISFYSMCEHHMLPFWGTVNIAYIPDGDLVVGLSKFARIVDYFSGRLQIQENLGQQIGEYIMKETSAKGVIVLIKAKHLCMAMRGVKRIDAETTTIFTGGLFCENDSLRAEYFKLLST